MGRYKVDGKVVSGYFGLVTGLANAKRQLEDGVRIMQAMQVSCSPNTSYFMGYSLQRRIGRWYVSTESQESTSRRFSTESQESTSRWFRLLSPSDLATGPQPAGNRPATDYDGRAQDQLEVRWEIPSPTGTTYLALLGSILVRVAAGDLEVK